MNNRFLVHGKDYNSGEFVVGNRIEIAVGIPNLIIERTKIAIQVKTPENLMCTEVDPETIGQCTGLKDKNGTLIFEGDIIKTKYFGKSNGNGTNFKDYDIFTVIYKDGSYIIEANDRSFSLSHCVNCQSKFEIIGNIHDNPELSEVEQ